MTAWSVASWMLAIGMGLVGLAAGRLWARMRSSAARRRRFGMVAALQNELSRQKLITHQLEAELHLREARIFELERDLEARENDWARSSETPFSFDDQTFQVEPSPVAEAVADSGEIEGLARRVEAIRDGVQTFAPVDLPDVEPGESAARLDDLTEIDGIDTTIEAALNAAGYRSFQDIAKATPEELVWALTAAEPTIGQARTHAWRDQAARRVERRPLTDLRLGNARRGGPQTFS